VKFFRSLLSEPIGEPLIYVEEVDCLVDRSFGTGSLLMRDSLRYLSILFFAVMDLLDLLATAG
jgi:hypothetical protein